MFEILEPICLYILNGCSNIIQLFQPYVNVCVVYVSMYVCNVMHIRKINYYDSIFKNGVLYYFRKMKYILLDTVVMIMQIK